MSHHEEEGEKCMSGAGDEEDAALKPCDSSAVVPRFRMPPSNFGFKRIKQQIPANFDSVLDYRIHQEALRFIGPTMDIKQVRVPELGTRPYKAIELVGKYTDLDVDCLLRRAASSDLPLYALVPGHLHVCEVDAFLDRAQPLKNPPKLLQLKSESIQEIMDLGLVYAHKFDGGIIIDKEGNVHDLPVRFYQESACVYWVVVEDEKPKKLQITIDDLYIFSNSLAELIDSEHCKKTTRCDVAKKPHGNSVKASATRIELYSVICKYRNVHPEVKDISRQKFAEVLVKDKDIWLALIKIYNQVSLGYIKRLLDEFEKKS